LRVDVISRVAIERHLRDDGPITCIIESFCAELTRDPDVNNTWQFNPGNAGDIVVVRVIPVVQREVWSNAGPGNR
jgi:hypothetical protein